MEDIKMPVYYIIEDEETGEKVYDFEEMVDELENRILEKLGKKVLITISELEEEEKEYCFNFRGKCLGVMAVSKESAYGYLYSEFDGVSKEELDDAYERGNQ